MVQFLKSRRDSVCASRGGQEISWRGSFRRAALLVLCLLVVLLTACDQGQNNNHRTVQTDNGSAISYSTLPQDVLVRIFYGGGKVGQLEMTPEISIYGDGTFILGPGLHLEQGALSTEKLQNLLRTLTSTDNLLQLHQQVFSDIPDQNVTLLQLTLNGRNYQFVYGPFGHLQENAQQMHEYQELGDAISTVRNALAGPVSTYTSSQMALLVSQTFRADFTIAQNQALPTWPLSDIVLADTAIYECGTIPQDLTGPNADNGCLAYTVPRVAYLPSQSDLQAIRSALKGQQEQLFMEGDNYYVVILRPLLPDEIVQQQLAMYGSNGQTYTPVPLKTGAIPVPTVTPQA
jgi:hypothetical protein